MTSNDLPFRSVLQAAIVGVLLLLVLVYAIFQARFLLIGPGIVLRDTNTAVFNERQIYLEGTAFNISRLWLNDRQIYTDAQGNFKEAFVLENGYTIATVRAEDRYGRTTVIERSYVYSPASFINE